MIPYCKVCGVYMAMPRWVAPALGILDAALWLAIIATVLPDWRDPAPGGVIALAGVALAVGFAIMCLTPTGRVLRRTFRTGWDVHRRLSRRQPPKQP